MREEHEFVESQVVSARLCVHCSEVYSEDQLKSGAIDSMVCSLDREVHEFEVENFAFNGILPDKLTEGFCWGDIDDGWGTEEEE